MDIRAQRLIHASRTQASEFFLSLLVLPYRQPKHQAVQVIGNRDLAGQATAVAPIFDELQQTLLRAFGRGGADLLYPALVNIDVTSRAGADTPAIAVQVWNVVVQCGVSSGRSTLDRHDVFPTVGLDVRHGGHFLLVHCLDAIGTLLSVKFDRQIRETADQVGQ
jgi:hypothetical protein